ncbi:hypothetical protein ACW9H6_20210 [Pseudomonas sp. SDO528_S397]
MNFRQNKVRLLALVIVFGVLLVVSNYGVKIMTSVYKQDYGNGVVVYADDYVKTGRWVFDCGYSRLISRQPLADAHAHGDQRRSRGYRFRG